MGRYAWPYPLWIAHRGAGALAPENTMPAFRLGASYGYRAFECDVKLSADDVPFLMHDATLERTTADGHGRGGDLTWRELAQLDAGGWHSPAYAGTPIATLRELAAFILGGGHALNIEIKPTPGLEAHTGEVVAHEAARLWQRRAPPPLLSSFQPAALEAARSAEPQLPRALLLEELNEGWLEQALGLGCVAVVTDYLLMDTATMARLRAARLRALCYTVNDAAQTQRLRELGIDGIITDAVDQFQPGSATPRTRA